MNHSAGALVDIAHIVHCYVVLVLRIVLFVARGHGGAEDLALNTMPCLGIILVRFAASNPIKYKMVCLMKR